MAIELKLPPYWLKIEDGTVICYSSMHSDSEVIAVSNFAIAVYEDLIGQSNQEWLIESAHPLSTILDEEIFMRMRHDGTLDADGRELFAAVRADLLQLVAKIDQLQFAQE